MIEACGRPCEVVARFVRAEAYEDARLSSRARQVLGIDELEVLSRLRPPEARRDYLSGHALARAMLSEIAGCDPSCVRLHCSPWGRPEVIAPAAASRLRFSVSHADGIALCAVARGCGVGADVESLRNVGGDLPALAEIVCSPQEIDALRRLPEAIRAESFLSTWTRKEAVAKATGLGFYLPLREVVVGEETASLPAPEAGACAGGDGRRARIMSLRPTRSHLAAIAVFAAPGTPVAIRFEEAEPLTAGAWSLRSHPDAA